ncbi:MAG: carbohydrate ABC transporter substrate-binding protein [Lachnospiraceae bacterium]|nr:carbohydrate ABC transporter substrate-binding protein [Lachnospiraceae bacterium]MBD5505453.1 carbohydrate ABC transporter substrate-binding protein [Lachnospiraceae bacterium]
MKLKKVLALTLAATMTFSLVGCGGDDTAANTPAADTSADDTADDTTDDAAAPAADDTADDTAAPAGGLTYASITLGEDYEDITTTIKFIHHKTDREDDGTMADLISKFNAMYPNITVETEGITDYAEDALLRLSTGDWGDVMFIPAVDAADLSSYFIPYGTVDEMSELVNFADQWKDTAGNCYGIGYMGNAQGILYNSKVFADAGITTLPTTPDDFIAALQAIKDNTDAIPLYTNYAAGWTMGGQWDAFLGAITTGDETWLNQKFVHTAEPFKDNGDGTGAYALYKILYDAVAQGLIEDDYTTTDWEGCKAMINNGEIGTMVLGSWAIAQMKAAGDNPDDIGYMPFPITVNGQQYTTAGPDYCYGININASDDNKAAAMTFVKFMVEESGWCDLEGGYPISKTAPTSFVFDGVNVVTNVTALTGEEDIMNEMNAESELSFNAGGDAKVQGIVEAAATGSQSFDDIMADWTAKWNDAQEALGVEVSY